MDPIKSDHRAVANIRNAEFQPLISDSGQEDGFVLQVNNDRRGQGFHIYKMKPGATTIAHTHNGDEEFYLIEGDLTDHDGYEYKPGDLVWLKSGTHHNSSSKNGCTLVVMFRDEQHA